MSRVTRHHASHQGFGVHHAINPDPYRGPFGGDGAAYANDVADLIAAATPGQVAGFFHETIQGVGGAVQLADGYLPLVYQVHTPQRWVTDSRTCSKARVQASAAGPVLTGNCTCSAAVRPAMTISAIGI